MEHHGGSRDVTARADMLEDDWLEAKYCPEVGDVVDLDGAVEILRLGGRISQSHGMWEMRLSTERKTQGKRVIHYCPHDTSWRVSQAHTIEEWKREADNFSRDYIITREPTWYVGRPLSSDEERREALLAGCVIRNKYGAIWRSSPGSPAMAQFWLAWKRDWVTVSALERYKLEFGDAPLQTWAQSLEWYVASTEGEGFEDSM